MNDEGDEADARDRKRPLKVVVSAKERIVIKEQAAATQLSISAYLRTLGVGYQPRSKLDQQAILALIKVVADQGRLGGLLKLWLTEKPGEGASTTDVRQLLRQIETAQMQLRKIIRELRGLRS